MVKIVGIRFRNAGKIYYFDPQDFELEVGGHAIVETARGVEYGTVLMAPREVADESVVQPLKKVIRAATEEDDQTVARNRERERSAYKTCQEKIAKHGLAMKLVQAEYTFDSNKLLFYFTADGRIDFRELVKDLAGVFRTRIELRQIGVRDETKMLGGIGICGRELCCCSYLSDFVPVSIKMAKEQNLSLNPTKISGVCGRLMCCLKNEQETYEYLNSRLPGIGDAVTAVDGAAGVVQNVNVLRQKVKVLIETEDEKELREYDVDELKFQSRKKKGKFSAKGLDKELHQELDQELAKELVALENLEDAEAQSDEQTQRAADETQEQKENKENSWKRDKRTSNFNRENREQREKKELRERRERDKAHSYHAQKSNYQKNNYPKNSYEKNRGKDNRERGYGKEHTERNSSKNEHRTAQDGSAFKAGRTD